MIIVLLFLVNLTFNLSQISLLKDNFTWLYGVT